MNQFRNKREASCRLQGGPGPLVTTMLTMPMMGLDQAGGWTSQSDAAASKQHERARVRGGRGEEGGERGRGRGEEDV